MSRQITKKSKIAFTVALIASGVLFWLLGAPVITAFVLGYCIAIMTGACF